MSDFDFSPRLETQLAINPEQREATLQARRAEFSALTPAAKKEFIAKFELLRMAVIAHRTRLAQACAEQAIQRARRGV